MFYYPKEGDIHCMAEMTPSVRIPSQISHLKLFIKNNVSSKTFMPYGTLLLLPVTSSGWGLVIIFLYIYLASVRGQQETLHVDEYCQNTVILPQMLFVIWSFFFFFLYPPMPTLILHIISEKCFLFGMPWARFKKRNRNALDNSRMIIHRTTILLLKSR